MQLLTQHKGFSFFISFVVFDHTLIFFVDEVAVWVIFSFWGFSTQPLSPSHCASLFKDNRLAEECVQNLMKQCLRCCFARVWKRLLSTARKTLFVLHTQPAPSPKNRWSISSSENESEAEYLPCGVSGRASLDSLIFICFKPNLLALCEIWV